MKLNISIVAHMLKSDADTYRKAYDEALEQKEIALKKAKNNFIGDALKSEKTRIEEEFNNTVVDLKIECAKGIETIEELRAQERKQLQNFDRNLAEKAKVLSDLPLTEDEFIAFMNDEKMSADPIAKKILIHAGEKSGIDVVRTGIGADYSTKINVLNQLEQQLSNLIANYPDGNHDRMEELRCKHAYLNEEVVKRSIEIYGGLADTKTAEEKADKAYYTVKGTSGDVARGYAIANALRNAKSEDVRNHFMYKLTLDGDISENTLQLSGAYNEIYNFRKNCFKDYEKAVEDMKRVRSAKEKEAVELVVNENNQNQFFSKMYQKERENNEYLRVLMCQAPMETMQKGENDE